MSDHNLDAKGLADMQAKQKDFEAQQAGRRRSFAEEMAGFAPEGPATGVDFSKAISAVDVWSSFPQKLSIWTSHPDYHPSYPRIGVKFNGVERNDIQWYDLAKRSVRLNKTNELLVGDIELFWRYPESRQQRRAREAWEKKKGGRRCLV